MATEENRDNYSKQNKKQNKNMTVKERNGETEGKTEARRYENMSFEGQGTLDYITVSTGGRARRGRA